MGKVADKLRALGAQHDVVTWAGEYHDDWLALFAECPRADWLLALAARFGAERAALMRAAVACSRFAMGNLSGDPANLETALNIAAAWAEGSADANSCEAEAARLYALAEPDDAVESTVRAAALATLGTVNEPMSAAHAALCAAQASVVAAGDCGMESALRFTHERCAELVRAELPPKKLAELARLTTTN